MLETTRDEGRLYQQIHRDPMEKAGEPEATKLGFYFADELQVAEIKPPSYILNTIIPQGRLIMGVGDSTQGKTPFGLQLARDVAGGVDFLDYYKTSSEPGRVALIDAESTKEDMGLRLKMQRGGRRVETGKNLLLLDFDRVLESKFDVTISGIERLRTFVEKQRVDLLILDNLWALAAGQDLAGGKIAQPILHALRKITRLPHSPSVLFFHHPRKNSDKHELPDLATMDFARWAEEASGSRIFFNLTDVRFGLQRCEKRGEEYTIFRGRSRVPGSDQDFGPLYLSVNEEHSLASIDNRPSVIELFGTKEREILDAMHRYALFGTKEAKLATNGDICDKTIRRAFQHGCEHGILRKLQPGQYEWVKGNAQPLTG